MKENQQKSLAGIPVTLISLAAMLIALIAKVKATIKT